MSDNPDNLYGVVVPLVTPLNPDGSVDEGGLRRLIRYILEGGVHGIFMMGTTGEFPRFTLEEWMRAVEVASDENAGRSKLYVGVSDCGSKLVARRIRAARSFGVDVIVLAPPFYYPLRDQSEIVIFYQDALSVSELPLLVYNIPTFAPTHFQEETWCKLAGFDGIAGVKDSSGDRDNLRFLISLSSQFPGFSVFVGDESLFTDGLLMGASGVVPSLGNVVPRLCVDLYNACLSHDEIRMNQLFDCMRDFNQLNACCASSLAPVAWKKKALEIMGICQSSMTQPFAGLESEVSFQIMEKLRRYKLIKKG